MGIIFLDMVFFVPTPFPYVFLCSKPTGHHHHIRKARPWLWLPSGHHETTAKAMKVCKGHAHLVASQSRKKATSQCPNRALQKLPPSAVIPGPLSHHHSTTPWRAAWVLEFPDSRDNRCLRVCCPWQALWLWLSHPTAPHRALRIWGGGLMSTFSKNWKQSGCDWCVQSRCPTCWDLPS